MTRITARLRDALAEIFPAKDSTDNLQMSDGIGNKVDTPKLVVNESTSALAYLKGIISEQPLVFGGGIAGRTITDVSLASPIGDNTDGLSWGTAYQTLQGALTAATSTKPFRIVGILVEPTIASQWYQIRLSADSGVTFFDQVMIKEAKKVGTSVPSGTSYIFNVGTRISGSVKAFTGGGDTIKVWPKIQTM